MPLATTLDALRALRALPKRPRRLLAVFSHPDDEAYGSAGVLARAGARDDTSVALLVLTSGEASSALRDRGLDEGAIRTLRESRMHDVADVVDLDALLLPRMPDGQIAWLGLDELSAPVKSAVDAFDPHVVIAQDVRGVNGHPDHVATHWAVRDALRTRPDIRFAMVCYPPDVAESAKPRLLFPTGDDQIDVRIDLSEAEVDAKERCLRIHEALVTLRVGEAQADGHVRPAVEHYDLLGEDFTPPLSDLFERLDGFA